MPILKLIHLAKTLISVAGLALVFIGLVGIGLDFFKGDGMLSSIWDLAVGKTLRISLQSLPQLLRFGYLTAF